MSRLKFTTVLMLAMLGGAAQAETASAEKTGGFLSSLLGIRGAAPAGPMKITAEPQAKGKASAPHDKTQALKIHPDATPQKDRPAKADKQKSTAKGEPRPAPVKQAAKSTAPIDPTGSEATAAIDGKPAEQPKPKKVALGPFRGGGSQAICVRTCDGFFFPVNYEGAQNGDRYAEACASSCPASRTEVYFMPRGADLTRAATARGERYSALDTAFKYRKERDATCSCKSETQTWSEILKPVDAMIKHDKNDILVTAEKSMELARPVDPEVAKAEADAAAAKKSARRGKKSDDKRQAKTQGKPAVDVQARVIPSPDLAKGGAAGPWKTTNKFVKVDPEPTASIR